MAENPGEARGIRTRNHELWSRDPRDHLEILKDIRDEAEGSNIHVLERDAFILGDLRVLGTTLWSDFAGWDKGYVHAALSCMNDYRYIGASSWYSPANARKLARLVGPDRAANFASRALFNPFVAYELHKKSLAWLQRQLKRPWEGETVVVTHHAPTLESLRRSGVEDWELREDGNILRRDDRLGPVYRAAYASDLDNLLLHHRSTIALWVHGHMHQRLDFARKSVRIFCNARGRYQAPLSDKDRKGYGFLGINLSRERIAEDQADHAKRPWRGENSDFEPGALVDLDEGLVPPLMLEIHAALEDMRPELSEARELAAKMGAADAVVRLALREAFEARISRLQERSLTILSHVSGNISQNHLALPGDDLRALAREYCGPHEYRHLSLSLRKGTPLRRQAALVIRDYEALIAGLLRFPTYLPRMRDTLLGVIAQAEKALKEQGIDATIESPAQRRLLRHVPPYLGHVRVASFPVDEDKVFKIVDEVANPGGPPRRWIFAVQSAPKVFQQPPTRETGPKKRRRS